MIKDSEMVSLTTDTPFPVKKDRYSLYRHESRTFRTLCEQYVASVVIRMNSLTEHLNNTSPWFIHTIKSERNSSVLHVSFMLPFPLGKTKFSVKEFLFRLAEYAVHDPKNVLQRYSFVYSKGFSLDSLRFHFIGNLFTGDFEEERNFTPIEREVYEEAHSRRFETECKIPLLSEKEKSKYDMMTQDE